MLEYSLIKQHRPRFNIRLRDDKSYPFLAVTVGDEWPRPMVMRGRKRKGVRYFGPYGHAYAIRETLDLLLRTFPLRTCSDNKFGRHERLGRPCLLFHIEKCSGPCVGEVDHETYDRLVDELLEFLDGDTDTIVRRLEARDAGGGVRARVRAGRPPARPADQRAQGHRAPADGGRPQRGHRRHRHRRGRPRGRGAGVLRPQGPGRRPQGLRARQGRGPGARRAGRRRARGAVRRPAARRARSRCWCPTEPDDPELYADWLSHLRGSRVAVRVPQRGAKRELQATVTRNATEEFTRHRLRRASDHNARARALNELQDALGLPEAPLRIECYDMSHIQGTDYVGSMVVMEDGLPKKSDYRRFKVRSVAGQRRLRGDGGGADPAADRLPRRAVAARGRAVGQVLVPAPAPARRRRQGPAQRGRAGARGAGPRRGDPGGVAGQAVRGGVRARARPTRCGCRGGPRPCTCCSASATRPTASPSPTTASSAASG